MEFNNIFLINSNAGFDINASPREFLNETSKVLSGLYFKMSKTDLIVNNNKIGQTATPRLKSEKTLYMVDGDKLTEFNPYLTDFEEMFNNSKKEELNEVFAYIETIYNKVLDIKNKSVVEEISENETNLDDTLSYKINKTSKGVYLVDVGNIPPEKVSNLVEEIKTTLPNTEILDEIVVDEEALEKPKRAVKVTKTPVAKKPTVKKTTTKPKTASKAVEKKVSK